MSPLLEITNLSAKVGGKNVLQGLSLTLNAGEVHAIMGPNGSGKSTLAYVLAGRPGYEITGGSVKFQGRDLLTMEAEERARAGMFLGFQYPVEIPGVNNVYLLKAAVNAKRKASGLPEVDAYEFLQLVRGKMKLMQMDESFLSRGVNEGFSGGEKKRNEILQMLVLEPALAVLDETDSGLDIDALKVVARGVNSLRTADRGVLLITHYQRLLDHIVPDQVHVLARGKIARSGDKTLAHELEKRGYDWVLEVAWMISLPTNRDENWRYANLRPLAKANADAVDAARSAPSTSITLPAALPDYERWVFVDGRFVAGLSAPAPDSCATLLNARDAGEDFSALLDAAMATEGADFALARVNGMRGDQVLHIAPPDGANAAIEITFVASAGAAAGTSYPRVQVHAGRNARLRIVERHVSADGADSAVNAAFDLALRADASIDHCRLQNVADAASCFDTLIAHVGERASYRLRTITLGGLTSRSTVLVKLAGRGARCELTAGSIANGIQTHDVFAEIEHTNADTVTRELYRGIATDRGKLGFNGKMIVRESAPGADSDQSLKTLLTGKGAEASVRPQLEIYTDKVRAKHGATTGKLDEQMLFYLLSRGIDRRTAQTLLQWAFIEDAISRMDCAPLRAEIELLVAAQLNEVSALEGLLGS